VRLDAVVRGSPVITTEWFKEGSDPSRSSFLAVGPISEADAGTYVFRATNDYGSVERRVTISIGAHSEITNVSARATTGPGEKSLILGFAISGDRFSKGIMIGALGSLETRGVTGSLNDPQATLYAPDGRTEFNDDTPIVAPGQGISHWVRTGAWLPLAPSKGSALHNDLLPGSYTVKVSGAGDTSGIVLANVFDADDYMGRIVNCSVRAYVGTGDAIAIPGFIIQGDKPKRLLIRGVGPTLSQFGVEAPLANPTLTVVDQKTGKPIVTNDDWGSDGNTDELMTSAASVGAFALPAKSKDAAVVITLPEGGYTVLVSGADGGTGVALMEIYELQ
jgi:hypothetical protein